MNTALRLILKLMSAPVFDMRKSYQAVRELQRLMLAPVGENVSVLDYAVRSLNPDVEIPVRIFYPHEEKKPGAVLYIHGGGWVIGDLDSYSSICGKLADSLGKTVFSIDYSLAPESPFPKGLEDCLTVVYKIIGYSPFLDENLRGPITLMGDSAGANLALVVTLLLREMESELADSLVLFYPATYWDHAEESSPFPSIREMGKDYGLTSKKIQEYMELYLPDLAMRKRPEVAPLLASDLSGLPATLVLTAEFDPLRDEGEALGRAMALAGNRVITRRMLGAPHGYLTYPDVTGAVTESLRLVKNFQDMLERKTDFCQNIDSVEREAEDIRSRVNSSQELVLLDEILRKIAPERQGFEDTPLVRTENAQRLSNEDRGIHVPSPRELLETKPQPLPDKKLKAEEKKQKHKEARSLRKQKQAERKHKRAAKKQQQRRNWLSLDNASKIFPAAMTDIDTKVFRISVELKEKVNPDILQAALDRTYANFPLYHCVLRRGFFWYYFQESQLKPQVQEESQAPVKALYQFDHHNLLFRVLYYKKRIHLEVFHALSDGTGAMHFMQLLIAAYLDLRHPCLRDYSPDIMENYQVSELERYRQLEDSFSRYFARPKHSQGRKWWRNWRRSLSEQPAKERKWKHVFQIKGTKTPDGRMRIFELTCSAEQLLQEARSSGVSLSEFLTSVYILAIYRARLADDRRRKNEANVTISVPVNLRNFFPSHSARNFFTTVVVGYDFSQGEAELEAICGVISSQYQEEINRDNLSKKLLKLYRFEENLALRPIFRPLKDFILKFFYKREDRQLTSAISNMGRVQLPGDLSDYIEQLSALTSARRPQFVCLTQDNTFSLCFSSPFMETDIQREFVRILSGLGLELSLSFNAVGQDNPAEEMGNRA